MKKNMTIEKILISKLDPLEYLLSNIHPFLLHALTLKAILNLGMHVKNIISHLNQICTIPSSPIV